VEVVSVRTSQLPGTHRIAPFAGFLPLLEAPRLDEQLPELRREWQANHDAVYSSDEAFPKEIAWLAGRGTLRKYSYVSVAFCPLTYHARSGRLLLHDEVEIAVQYELPPSGSAEARLVDLALHDRVADEKAASLFANFAEIADLYEPGDLPLAGRRATHDYVIVTTADLVGAVTASSFPAYKAAVGHNLRTVLTTDSEIAGQPGGDLAEKIRNFLRNRYALWGIEYVLLVGDYATVPMRVCYPDPSFHVYNPSDPGLVAPGTPTDYYYADLSLADDVSWDSDGDGFPGEYLEDDPDFLAEVAVGRIPVNDSTRIHYSLDKLVAYDQDTGAWKSNAVLAGAILFFENQNYSGYRFLDGASCLDSLGTALMSGWTVSKYSEQSGIVTSLYPWPALTETSFNTAWRTGEYAVVNWSGHGWCDGAYRTIWEWDDGDGVPESANGEIRSRAFINRWSSNLDDDHPSIVFGISCNVGFPDPNPYGNLGIDLLTLPGWGASAGIVSSSRPAAVAGHWRSTGGGTEQICYEFNRHMLALRENVGDALYDGKFYATTNFGWDHVYEWMNLYNFNLYGDPSLAVDRSQVTDVALELRDEPDVFPRLDAARPNPFVMRTDLHFALPGPAAVRIAVYDVGGRVVAELADRDFAAGDHTVAWDGRNDQGEPLASGLYFVALEVGGRRAVSKVVRFR
jgi:hypothetical protein